MAGLGRVQQLFNRAVLGTVAALIGFARGGDKQATQHLLAYGHPILAKYLKCSAPRANTPGYAYPGFCAGERGTLRRYQRLHGYLHEDIAA
jgi:hypothetical protein